MSKHTQDFVQVIFEYACMHESIDSHVICENGIVRTWKWENNTYQFIDS